MNDLFNNNDDNYFFLMFLIFNGKNKLDKDACVFSLVFEICELFLQIAHFIQTLNPPPLTVLLIHFLKIKKNKERNTHTHTHTHSSRLGIMRYDGKWKLFKQWYGSNTWQTFISARLCVCQPFNLSKWEVSQDDWYSFWMSSQNFNHFLSDYEMKLSFS